MLQAMTRIRLRIDFDGERYVGHGRIELLELIGRHGSISKAAQAMSMSYKRAWYLIDGFNAMFREPLIERQHGGKGGGSATLTPFGERVVAEYRAMEARALEVFAGPVGFLEANLAKSSTGRRKAKDPVRRTT
jgi:molybdate transport system regulatory protein